MFRLGGLVLEGSIVYPSSSSGVEFVTTDLIKDIVVRHDGSLHDLFREGHSVVAEGFVKPFTDEIKKDNSLKKFYAKARSREYYFCAYISQHDIHYGEATVRETLNFSSRCLGVGNRYKMLMEL